MKNARVVTTKNGTLVILLRFCIITVSVLSMFLTSRCNPIADLYPINHQPPTDESPLLTGNAIEVTPQKHDGVVVVPSEIQSEEVVYNFVGPWHCSYFDNEEGKGDPLATTTMDYLASDWQKKNGYNYDGVPILNFTRSGFYLKCRTIKEFQPGTYKLMPFVRADLLRVTVDDMDLYYNANLDRRNDFIDLNPLYFDTMKLHYIEVTVGVTMEGYRSWVMFSWSRIHSQINRNLRESFTPYEKIGCATTPECHGPSTICHSMQTKGLGRGEEPWGLCEDYVALSKKCLIYSIGIRNIYSAELMYGRERCEVHAFDCTINHPQRLGPNVTFHPWCLGSNSSELKLDGAMSSAMELAAKGEFLDLPTIIKRLGHEGEELTILKMDCEGCEWNGLDILSRDMPQFFSRIRMLLLEMHYVTELEIEATEGREEQLKTISRVADSLSNYRTFRFSINSDLSIERFTNPTYFKQLYNVGVFVGACCYEMSMVRKDLAA